MFICIAVLIELHIACGENRTLNSDDASPVPGTGNCSGLKVKRLKVKGFTAFSQDG